MAGTRRDPAHREIIYKGAIAGLTRDQINARLAKVGARELPESSYRSIMKDYVPYFRKDPRRLAKAIQSPPTWSDLRDA